MNDPNDPNDPDPFGPAGSEHRFVQARLASPDILADRLLLRVMRPHDHLVFNVSASRCAVIVGEDQVPRLVPANDSAPARLIVTLPPQHVHEQVFQANQSSGGAPEQPELPAGARFSGPSRLVFVLGAQDVVDLTLTGILTAMSRLQLAVAPLAEPYFTWHLLDVFDEPAFARVEAPSRVQPRPAGMHAAQSAIDRVRATRTLTAAGLGLQVATLPAAARQVIEGLSVGDRSRVIDALRNGVRVDVNAGGIILVGRPAPRSPKQTETALEVPSRLQLSPSQFGAWAHSPGVDETPGATVELWNTRLGVRGGTPDAPTVDEVSTDQRIVRAIWTRDRDNGSPPLPETPFATALTPKNRDDIVTLSTGSVGTPWFFPPPTPVQVNALALTSLGASIDVRGSWDSDEPALAEWQHRTTLGRDQYVRVVTKGYMCPFGHRAVYITETCRRADPTLPEGEYAVLWQRHFVTLRDRIRSYTQRDMPFVQVTIDPKTTPDVNYPGPDPIAFWPVVGAKEFEFTISAVDADGAEHRYHAPLLWVRAREGGVPTPHDVFSLYGLADDGGHEAHDSPYAQLVNHDLGGKRVAVASKGATGEASYETRSLRFTANLADTTCTPSLLSGQFVIPAIAATTGQKDAKTFSFADAYVQHGFSPTSNQGEVVLQSVESMKLAFGSSDRSGGFLQPDQHIAGIARGTGPVSDLAAAAAGTPADPSSLFAGIGKLLGLFELADILDALGLGDVPAYAAQVLDVVGALTGGINRAVELLETNPVAVQLNTAASALDTLIHQTPAPTSADFATFISATLSPAVTAGLQPAVLDTLGKAESAIVKRALTTVFSVIHPTAGLPIDPAALLASIAAGVPTASALNHIHLEWRPPIRQWPAGTTDDAIFLPSPSNDRSLLVAVDVRGGDLVGQPSIEILAQLTDFTLQLLPGMPLIHIPFNRLYFRSTTGSKTEIDVELGELKWLGVLGFVDTLRQLIPSDGFSDPPEVSVDAQGIDAGFSLVLPNVAVGVFNLSNLSVAADIQLPFIGDSPSVGFSFCSRERPFTVAVLFLGGGGFFGLRLSPNKLVLLEAAIEFGATLALDFGVASGSVSCMAGVYLRLEADDGSLTGYLRIRGEVDVLGLISACIEMYMGLTYEFGSGKVVGRATITVEVEVLLFSASVSISAERKFAGSKGDPTFVDALGPYVEPDCPWITYCQAFAEV
jgi:hypothetical protein